MANKEVEKEAYKAIEDKSKTFFSINNLTITDQYVSYRSMDINKKIYIRNAAGTSFYNARIERMMSILTFIVGIIGIYYYKRYDIIFILIASILFMVGGIVGFILSKNKLTIHSNASALSISYKLSMREKIEDIQKALDDAIKYSKGK